MHQRVPEIGAGSLAGTWGTMSCHGAGRGCAGVSCFRGTQGPWAALSAKGCWLGLPNTVLTAHQPHQPPCRTPASPPPCRAGGCRPGAVCAAADGGAAGAGRGGHRGGPAGPAAAAQTWAAGAAAEVGGTHEAGRGVQNFDDDEGYSASALKLHTI